MREPEGFSSPFAFLASAKVERGQEEGESKGRSGWRAPPLGEYAEAPVHLIMGTSGHPHNLLLRAAKQRL